jgi:hypothetical protein
MRRHATTRRSLGLVLALLMTPPAALAEPRSDDDEDLMVIQDTWAEVEIDVDDDLEGELDRLREENQELRDELSEILDRLDASDDGRGAPPPPDAVMVDSQSWSGLFGIFNGASTNVTDPYGNQLFATSTTRLLGGLLGGQDTRYDAFNGSYVHRSWGPLGLWGRSRETQIVPVNLPPAETGGEEVIPGQVS